MSYPRRRTKLGLSNEELEQQRADMLNAQEKAKNEMAEKSKMKNKGYGNVERKPYTRKDSEIPAKQCKTSDFCARFPVSADLTTVKSIAPWSPRRSSVK
jgi:hypothetical protein